MNKLITTTLLFSSQFIYALPPGFVYLNEVNPTIQQDMRYAQNYNFIGHVIPGYNKATCILTKKAASQLNLVQKALRKKGYSLKVYDCYRPTQAVQAFYKWSQNLEDTKMKSQFYPRENKKLLFKHKYIALSSGHSRGSTVDLTLVKIGQSQASPHPSPQCYGQSKNYLNDNSLDMGTRFDCLDVSARYNYKKLTAAQKENRKLLKEAMTSQGFHYYPYEWWHYTLKNETYPKQYFNFPVE